MHYHCEIIMPPTEDVDGAIETILKPFQEESEDANHPFFDFYVIGGRWAGKKLIAAYPESLIDEFNQWLINEKITVSGLQCGKQEISPASQVPKVDAKWNEMFPGEKFQPCPLFRHSNNQYGHGNGTIDGDVCQLKHLPDSFKCSRVIMAAAGYDGKVRAEFMLVDSEWNGCNHMPIDWDGTVQSALKQYARRLNNMSDKFMESATPKPDWLVVTVDYHS